MGMVTGIAVTVAAGWGLVVAVLYVMQRSILFVPDTARPDPSTGRAPMMEIVRTTTEDGLDLEGWWHPPGRGRPTLVYFHGNGGNVGSRDAKARRIIERGYGLLLASYRGYGGNPGTPSESGLIADGHAWMDWLTDRGVPAPSALLYGESLGSGVATALALERPVAALVLEAPYTSIVDIAAARYWFVPVRRLLLDRFDTGSRLPRVRVPVLIVHGSADRVIPPEHGARLFEAAADPKRLVRFEGAGHTDLFEFGALDVVDRFLDEVVPPGPWSASRL